jgi:hypothetical protein
MDLSMEQFLELYALPWAIKIVQALAIFIIGKWLAASRRCSRGCWNGRGWI